MSFCGICFCLKDVYLNLGLEMPFLHFSASLSLKENNSEMLSSIHPPVYCCAKLEVVQEANSFTIIIEPAIAHEQY